MLPNVVIIGAQKSASSFLQACLSDHPDVYFPEQEIPFFESPDYEQSTLAQLEQLFAGRREKCLGIKRPSYIGKPEVPARIARHLPDAKLIAVLRNPVDRAISAYFHNINYGFVPPLDLTTGMERLLHDPSYASAYPRAPEIIEFGYYHKYLRQYGRYLKDGRLLVFFHEDIVADPLASVQRAYRFLAVSEDFVPSSLHARPQQVLYNLRRLKVLTKRNRFLYTYNADRTRVFPKNMTVLDTLCARTITLVDRKVLSRVLPNTKPRVEPKLRAMLYDLYADDISALESLLGRDLSAWKSRATAERTDARISRS